MRKKIGYGVLLSLGAFFFSWIIWAAVVNIKARDYPLYASYAFDSQVCIEQPLISSSPLRGEVTPDIEFIRIPLDEWFTSGVSWASVWLPEKGYVETSSEKNEGNDWAMTWFQGKKKLFYLPPFWMLGSSEKLYVVVHTGVASLEGGLFAVLRPDEEYRDLLDTKQYVILLSHRTNLRSSKDIVYDKLPQKTKEILQRSQCHRA